MADEVVKERIAKITGAHLGWEDHGIFTAVLDLDYGDAGAQGAGLPLDTYSDEAGHRVGTAQGMDWIMRLMRACGVNEWDKLAGRTVIATATYSRVLGIKPLPTEPGEAFMFDELEGG